MLDLSQIIWLGFLYSTCGASLYGIWAITPPRWLNTPRRFVAIGFAAALVWPLCVAAFLLYIVGYILYQIFISGPVRLIKNEPYRTGSQ